MTNIHRHLIAMLMLASLFAPGCQTPALDPGPYNGDVILFTADQTIGQGFRTLDSFVTWEFVHRASLAEWPDIKRAADMVRSNIKEWRDAALLARDAYAINPTEENRSELQKAIAVIRAALATAAQFQQQHKP